MAFVSLHPFASSFASGGNSYGWCYQTAVASPAALAFTSGVATALSTSGCQAGMLDGSVRNINTAANSNPSQDFTPACQPWDTITIPDSNW